MRLAFVLLVFASTTVLAAQRDVWIASRRVHKGSEVSCADFHVERRKFRDESNAVGSACNIVPGSVALRELASGDVLRSSDTGAPLAVLSGTRVRVDVGSGSVTVSVFATALEDARVGDVLDVRLQHPIRTFKTRVVAPGAAMLLAGES